MDNKTQILFREVQKFSTWLRLLIAFSMGVSAVLAVFTLNSMFRLDDSPPLTGIVLTIAIGLLLPVLIIVLFLLLKLQSEVRPDGLYIRFFPLHIKFRKFTPDQIEQHYPRTYKPIREYGGWGIRCDWKAKNSIAYNVSGNKGLQLILKSGKKLLLGTQNPDALNTALDSISPSES